MNYLAHAFLSGRDEDLIIGNFIADHIRGNQFNHYPPSIIEGIYLHRNIDSFTDSHPAFKASKRVFYDGFERHSGILIDIYFDYFLAKDFFNYSGEHLNQFSQTVYGIYQKSSPLLPPGSQRFLEYVLRNNIYTSYADLAGIGQVLMHLSQRIKHGVKLHESVEIFTKNEAALHDNFQAFFKDARLQFLK